VLLSLKGNTPHAILALADGTVFIGNSIGAAGSTVGEVVFNTAMTGYQEILTDPSYCQQIVTLTYPHIGNYGINAEDVEAEKVHAAGLIIKDLPLLASNFRMTMTLSEYLVKENTVAIAEMMVVGERAGVAPATLIDAVSKGSGDSFALRNHARKSMQPRQYPEKSFPPEYVLKDISYTLELAQQTGVSAHAAELAKRYYAATAENGYSGRYFPAVIEMVDRNIKLPD
jgi:hypothetical protein